MDTDIPKQNQFLSNNFLSNNFYKLIKILLIYMLSYSLSDVNNIFNKEKKENSEMGEEDLYAPKISISNPTGFCLNCNSKIKGRYFCNKDCESTYRIKEDIKNILIPNLEEEIDTLISDKQNINFDSNYRTNYDKLENLIKSKELLLKKYIKGAGLTYKHSHPDAIPILKKGGKKTKKNKKTKKTKRLKKNKKSIKKQYCKYGGKK